MYSDTNTNENKSIIDPPPNAKLDHNNILVNAK